ncbi:hypothetical protein OAP41_04350 [Candidatus Poseidoniaceae archaeon]|nr:hypothetical protein [Candidatus Poseidoniaceae archaeon]
MEARDSRFMRRLTKPDVVRFIRERIDPNAESLKGNWIEVNVKSGMENIFFSQTKPSAAGKGHWKYDFFHTLAVERIGEIAATGAMLVLINYVDKVWVILDGADLVWLCTYSSRRKSNDGMVCDIVIERNDAGEYLLRPYDRMKVERRRVEVKPW